MLDKPCRAQLGLRLAFFKITFPVEVEVTSRPGAYETVRTDEHTNSRWVSVYHGHHGRLHTVFFGVLSATEIKSDRIYLAVRAVDKDLRLGLKNKDKGSVDRRK